MLKLCLYNFIVLHTFNVFEWASTKYEFSFLTLKASEMLEGVASLQIGESCTTLIFIVTRPKMQPCLMKMSQVSTVCSDIKFKINTVMFANYNVIKQYP